MYMMWKHMLNISIIVGRERGVLYVGNGSHFCTPVLMNMCNITFQVLRLSTFVFNKCSEKKIFTIIFEVKNLNAFGWNNFGPASQTVAQHYISIWSMYRVIWCFWRRDVKGHQYNAAVRKHGTITQCCLNDGPASKTVCQHWNSMCLRKEYNRHGDRLVLGQRRRRLTGIKPAIGCNASPTLNRNLVDRPTSSVPGTS